MQANQIFSLTALFSAVQTLIGITRPWFIAACLLMSAVLLLPNVAQLDNSYLLLLAYLPYGLGIIVLILGQQFVQGRIAMAAANLLVGYAVIQIQLQAPLERDSVRAYFTLLSLFWPLNFFIIYWLPERKLISPLGGFLAMITIMQLISGYLLTQYTPELSTLLERYFTLQPFEHDPSHPLKNWLLPLLNSWMLLSICLVLFVHTLIKKDRSNCILLASLITSILICAWFDQPIISSLFSSLIACALLITLLFNSHDLAFIDELTGLAGRRALMNELKHCGKNYCIVMADIDHFKQFNDTHGHDTGDDVLRIVAQELGKVKGGGKAFRYGGEEFTLLFKRKNKEEAEPYVENIRKNIEEYPLIIRDKKNRPKRKNKKSKNKQGSMNQVSVTVSFGMAQKKEEQKAEDVMKSADQALYRAKESGRNCISN